jgi:hypothetical protein
MDNRSDTHLEEISKDIKLYFSGSPIFDGWAESRGILLDMLDGGESWLHALPSLSCQAGSGNQVTAIPVSAAWMTLLHAANSDR